MDRLLVNPRNYYFGDTVNMHGGRGNTGIVKHQAAPADAAASPGLQQAVAEPLRPMRELRASVPPAGAQALDDSLPDITADAAVPPQQRYRALPGRAGRRAPRRAGGGRGGGGGPRSTARRGPPA
ncbi:hypothetical protein, partial [Streptomyces mexicanus]|uniref:hypothetical protein n=1 Tax=Streptomyces mexicanus TaxID=178566 RepID=UPI00364952CA